MEIIIAMTIGFVLGAYIRQPFHIVQRHKDTAKPAEIVKPKLAKKTPEELYDEAYHNAVTYDGSEQPKIKEFKDE